jgi:hypothetical protein
MRIEVKKLGLQNISDFWYIQFEGLSKDKTLQVCLTLKEDSTALRQFTALTSHHI